MISKELLSQVLSVYILANPIKEKNNQIGYLLSSIKSCTKSDHRRINIHELAHKCKEWALAEDYILKTHSLKSHSICTVVRIIEKSPYIDTIGIYNLPTEPEAIFKACEWILTVVDTKKYKKSTQSHQ